MSSLTLTPKWLDLKLGESVTMSCPCEDTFEVPPDHHTNIKLWFVELLFVGSPRCRVHIVKGKVECKGYLNKFVPSNTLDGEPVMTCTVTPVGVIP